MILYGLLFCLITAVMVILGDIAIKVAADRASILSPAMIAGVLLYAVSAILWFFAMRYVSLAQAAVAYSMLTLIALVIIGAVGFGENLGKREVVAVACALLAMALMGGENA